MVTKKLNYTKCCRKWINRLEPTEKMIKTKNLVGMEIIERIKKEVTAQNLSLTIQKKKLKSSDSTSANLDLQNSKMTERKKKTRRNPKK